MPPTQKTITLRARPKKGVDSTLGEPMSTFALVHAPVPSERELTEGEVLVRTLWVGIEPSMRAWLSEARSYLPPVKLGDPMRSVILGTVVASKSPKFKVGDKAKGTASWSEYCVVPAKELGIVREYQGTSELDALGVLGLTGQTAYWGMMDVGRPKKGDVVVVSGAAGATGSIACQIALILGCKVIAIAGSPDKCRWLEKDIGVHKAINYKDADFKEQFKKHVGFFDVFFDNVGGTILNLALTRMKLHARIVMCGAIEDYNSGSEVKGLSNYQNLIPMRGTMQGFIIMDYIPRFKESEPQLAKWIAEGKLQSATHVFDGGKGGIEAAPRALVGLFAGQNLGKMVVKVWDEEEPKSKL